MNLQTTFRASLLMAGILTTFCSSAQQKQPASAQELAAKLSNPVANLISVPLQTNVDYGIGPYNGAKFTMNFQPVIPIHLSPKTNLITRYIVPIVDQHNIGLKEGRQFGLSDATISAFFTPVNVKNGFIWGVGPAFLIPTGTEELLSTRQWAAGPTALILKQSKGLTYGFLMNQLWSYAGDSKRSDVNQMFLQPFFQNNWKSGAGVGLNAEMTFNWPNHTTTAYLIPSVSGVTKLGKQAVSLALGPRIPLGAPDGTKSHFGLRAALTFIFPQ